MSMTTAQTCVEQVLRLRAYLPSSPREWYAAPVWPATSSVSAEKEEGESLACGMCFPYWCSCSETLRPPSPSRPFLRPLNLVAQASRAAAARFTRHGRQTNIEAEKRARAASSAGHAPGAVAPLPSSGLAVKISGPMPAQLCTRCSQPMPSALRTTRSSNALNSCTACHVYTGEELSQHAHAHDLWLSINGRAYDLTSWAPTHPGGMLPLEGVAGSDASDVFRVFHAPHISGMLPKLQVGVMGEWDVNGRLRAGAWDETPMQRDFHLMIEQLRSKGWFTTDLTFYYKHAAFLATLFVLAVVTLLWARTLQSSLGIFFGINLGAFFLGMFWQQIAFLGHDLGHNSVRGSSSKDWAASTLITCFFGISVQWWKRSHNVHHVLTNSVEHDPDIQYLPVLAVNEKILHAAPYHSTYHGRPFTLNTFARWCVAHQHLLYYPVMGIARLNLYVQSATLVLNRNKVVPNRAWEVCALAFFFTWLFALLALAPNWWSLLLLINTSHWVAGLTHVQITLSHFSQPVYEGRGYTASCSPEAREHFLRTQFATAMDVSCPTWLDWLHGGLQFQVTHHLIPRIPRHRLREVRETFMKPFAAKYGLEYKSASFLEANQQVFYALKQAALVSRDMPDNDIKESMLWHFLHAEG